MAMTKQFPVKESGDVVTAANWNGIESYRLIEGEENDYDAGTNQMSYSYIADTATVGVLIMATAYFSEGVSEETKSQTTTIEVDSVAKQTVRATVNENWTSGGGITVGANYPVVALLTAADMTLDANHTITVDTDIDKVTSMIVHLL